MTDEHIRDKLVPMLADLVIETIGEEMESCGKDGNEGDWVGFLMIVVNSKGERVSTMHNFRSSLNAAECMEEAAEAIRDRILESN